MEETIVQAQKLFEDFEKTTFKVIQEQEEIKNSNNSPQNKLSNIKSELCETKWKFINLQSNLFFLDFLQSENQDDWLASNKDIEAELKLERKKVIGYKDSCLELAEEIEEASYTAEEKYNCVTEKMNQLKIQLDDLEQMKESINSIKSQRKELVVSSIGIEERDLDEHLENQKKKLAATEQKILLLTAENKKTEADIQYLKESCENLDVVLMDKEKQKEKLEALKCTELVDIKNRIKWCQDTLQFVTELSGVREKEVKKDSLIIEFLHPSSEDVPLLELTLGFGKGKYVECSVKKVEVNINEFDIDDIIDYGVKENDVKFIIQQLKHRWLSYQPLYSEISQLRKRFAINWLYKVCLLKVTVGTNKETICTLCIDPQYPANGDVTLNYIKTQEKDVLFKNLKPPVEKPSLTAWVEFLHQILQ